jgi:hypothetical protein
MSVKLILLKSGEKILTNAKEAVDNGKTQAYVFNNPMLVKVTDSYLLVEEGGEKNSGVNVTLTPWIVFTEDKDIVVAPDYVVSIVEPVKELKEMYLEKFNDSTEQND